MDTSERHHRKQEARRRLSAQRNRAGQLRGRVIATALICFALLWGVVFVQMATGNDPVLGERSTAATRKTKHRTAAATDRRRRAIESKSETAPEAEVELEPLTTSQS